MTQKEAEAVAESLRESEAAANNLWRAVKTGWSQLRKECPHTGQEDNFRCTVCGVMWPGIPLEQGETRT